MLRAEFTGKIIVFFFKKVFAIREKVCYNNLMKEKAKLKIGEEVWVDGVWAMVEEVDGDHVYVIDEDGNDQYVACSAVELY